VASVTDNSFFFDRRLLTVVVVRIFIVFLLIFSSFLLLSKNDAVEHVAVPVMDYLACAPVSCIFLWNTAEVLVTNAISDSSRHWQELNLTFSG